MKAEVRLSWMKSWLWAVVRYETMNAVLVRLGDELKATFWVRMMGPLRYWLYLSSEKKKERKRNAHFSLSPSNLSIPYFSACAIDGFEKWRHAHSDLSLFNIFSLSLSSLLLGNCMVHLYIYASFFHHFNMSLRVGKKGKNLCTTVFCLEETVFISCINYFMNFLTVAGLVYLYVWLFLSHMHIFSLFSLFRGYCNVCSLSNIINWALILSFY